MFLEEFLFFLEAHIFLFVVWCILLFFVFYVLIVNWMKSFFEVSCNQAVLLMNRRNAIVLDIRDSNEYYSGYIINSVNIPLQDIKKNDFISSGRHKNNPLIIVCDSSNVLLYKTRRYLSKVGFLEVYVLKGGMNNWKNQSFPVYSNRKKYKK